MRRLPTSLTLAIALLAPLLGAGTPASAGTVVWADWTSFATGSTAAPGSAAGTIGGTIGISYSGQLNFETQIGQPGDTNYWIPSAPYISPTVSNAPDTTDIIALTSSSPPVTITFSAPVVNPIMAILSLGRSTVPVNYDFDAPFDILSYGPGFFAQHGEAGLLEEQPGDVLHGVEGHGVIRFVGTFTQIHWTATPNEFWHGFTFGVLQDDGTVPEPASAALLALGGLALARARRAATSRASA